MKSKFVILLLLLVALTSRADFTNSLTATPNTLIPDGNPVGLTSTLTFSGVAGPINDITVTLNITGGFNGDLSGGGQSTLVSWGLTVVTVPEPQTWTILGGGLTGFWLLARKRRS